MKSNKEICEEIYILGKKLLSMGVNPRFAAQTTASRWDKTERQLAEDIIAEAKRLTAAGINPRFTCLAFDYDLPKRGRGAIRPLKNGGHWNHIKEGGNNA